MIKFADLFAGGGGTTTGALMVPGVTVVWALNHDTKAIQMHAANHPETKHYQADIRTQSTDDLEPVDVLWASLECTEHSKAKGGQDKNTGSFTLGWELHRYLIACTPEVLIVENVPEFRRWGELKNGQRVKNKEGLEYLRWVKSIKALGYHNYEFKLMNAANYGCPTRRIRYFGVFSKNIPITWLKPTHAEVQLNGYKKWLACKDFIKLEKEGTSIFGREINENIPRHLRKPLSKNTMRRIAGGIRKFAPELFFILKYYGNGNNVSSIQKPLHTVTTKDRHALVKLEKLTFIQDHCHTDQYSTLEAPLPPQLTRQTKQLITLEKKQLLVQHYSGNHSSSIEKPIPTITTVDHNTLISARADFVSAQYNSNGKPEANNQSIDKPLNAITTGEKFQFISTYFNSGGKPESQNQSIDKPLNTILTAANKKALVTCHIDFDIKMRFLDDEELASIMGFPAGYFNKMKLSKKEKIKMIGNAVPTGLARAVILPIIKSLTQN